MRKIITFLLLFVAFYGNAQVKVESIDAFTKLKKIEYRVAKKQDWISADNVFKGRDIVGRFAIVERFKDDVKALSLDMFLNYRSGCIAPDKTKIIFLLENDETVELINYAPVECNQYLDPKFSITEEQIVTLSNYLIKGIRFYYTDGYVELELKKDKPEVIKQTFKFYLENNN